MWLLWILLWPLLELIALIRLGQEIGVGGVLLYLIGGGLLGSLLWRWQGWRVWSRLNSQLRDGQQPAQSMLDQALIWVAGLLLFIPGPLSDILAVSLLVPWVRYLLRQRLLRWLQQRANVTVFTTGSDGQTWTYHSEPQKPAQDPGVIDVEFERIPDDPRRLTADDGQPPR